MTRKADWRIVMATPELARLVAQCVSPISPLLYQDTAIAITNAENRVGDLVRRGHLHLRSLTTRAELRAQLEGQALSGWVVMGNPALMGELYLHHPEAGMTLRVLKERRRTYPGGVPVAGSNRARQQYWAQDTFPGMPQTPRDNDEIRLLLLWDLVSATDIGRGFVLRVVRTTAVGQYGSSVPIDLSVDLSASGAAWEHLQFVGYDEPEDFFRIDVDEATDDGQQAQGM
jgi:hypothetical protein